MKHCWFSYKTIFARWRFCKQLQDFGLNESIVELRQSELKVGITNAFMKIQVTDSLGKRKTDCC